MEYTNQIENIISDIIKKEDREEIENKINQLIIDSDYDIDCKKQFKNRLLEIDGSESNWAFDMIQDIYAKNTANIVMAYHQKQRKNTKRTSLAI